MNCSICPRAKVCRVFYLNALFSFFLLSANLLFARPLYNKATNPIAAAAIPAIPTSTFIVAAAPVLSTVLVVVVSAVTVVDGTIVVLVLTWFGSADEVAVTTTATVVLAVLVGSIGM